jgi:Predicted transcriptional regulators
VDIVILEKSDKPIYEQIYEQATGQILSGKLPAGYCLPSIRTLAADLGVSVITVKKAYETLETEGFIYTRAGKGSFVAEYRAGILDDKKFSLAADRLKKDVAYYKNLQITEDEFIEMARKEWRD